MKEQKKRYNFICPNCLYEQSAAPSLLMEMGYNGGHGSCMNCDVFLHLEIVPDLDGHEMKATLWSDYLEKKKVMTGQKLQLVCRKCGNEWEETLPEGHHVRCEKNNNFLVDRRRPQIKKPFNCPSCGARKNIGMLALYRETKAEVQMICDTYFLHMIKNHESSSWLEFTVHEDDNEFEIEFDISFPNCCRVSFYDDLKYVFRYK